MALMRILGLETFKRVVKGLGDLSVGIKDARLLHTKIGLRVLRWVNDQFRTEGRQPGSRGAWPKLRPNTVAGRRQGSRRILQDTGQLRASFTSKPTASDVRVGTAKKIAAYHEFGTAPYEIRPRRAKALRFPVAKGGIMIEESAAATRFGQRFTPRQRAAGAVQSIFGRRRPVDIRGTRKTRFAFAKFVQHPGLPVRSMLPTEEYGAFLAGVVATEHTRDAAKRANIVIAGTVKPPE